MIGIDEFYLYRAIPNKEIILSDSIKDNLLSEAMSRVMQASGVNKHPYFICLTEDPKIAYKYSKKEGYSGEIGRIKVRVCKDGSLVVVGNEQAEVYRTWHMTDWLYLSKKSNWPQSCNNINYRSPRRNIEDVITYQGRRAPRAYAHADRGFLLHSSIPISYEILSEEEIEELRQKKPYVLKSYRLIKYDFSDDVSQNSIKKLICAFEKKDTQKAYTRIMLEQLNALIA